MIKHGHSWSEIQNYTSAQIKLFYECAMKLEAEERAALITDTAIASQGTEKSIKQAIDQLMR